MVEWIAQYAGQQWAAQKIVTEAGQGGPQAGKGGGKGELQSSRVSRGELQSPA